MGGSDNGNDVGNRNIGRGGAGNDVGNDNQ